MGFSDYITLKLFLVLVVDAITCILATAILNNWNFETWESLKVAFDQDTMDTLLLVFARFVLFVKFGHFAIRVVTNVTNPKKKKQLSSVEGGGDEKSYSLLDDELPATDANEILERGESKKARKEKERRARFWSATLLALLFVCVTATSVYSAIKTVMYNFPASMNQTARISATVLMALGPLLANIELALLNTNVENFLKPRGVFIPTLHIHEVMKADEEKKQRRWCDLCRSRIDGEMWQCKPCGFDVCKPCYKKQLEKMENAPRGKQTKNMMMCMYSL